MINRLSKKLPHSLARAALWAKGSASEKAFSLIEVVIALSVVSLAVLTVVGMLSGALLNFSYAEQKSAYTQIHDQVLHDVQQLQWSAANNGTQVTFTPTSPLYFDADADELPNSGSTGVIYQAIVTPNTAVNVPATAASTQFVDGGNNPSMATVTTAVYRYPGPTSGIPLAWYTDYVARY